MKQDVVARLLASKRVADDAACAVRAARAAGTLTEEQLAQHVRAYVLAKYRLAPADCASERLDALAEASLAKMLAMDPDAVGQADGAATCDGADSATVKQALLLMALQRDFGVEVDGFQVAFAETLDDLTALLWKGAWHE